MAVYLRPDTLRDALAALADPALTTGPAPVDRLAVLAGGTDFYPARTASTAWLRPAPRNVLDISGIEELRGIRIENGAVAFGALATWSEICAADLPPAFDGLKRAAREVGGVQVQNRGTIAGNICNASPAADGVPPLLTLDAEVHLASVRGARRVPLSQFVTGNRKTAQSPDELVVAVVIPRPAASARGTFLKLGARTYLVISIASVAALIEPGLDGVIARAAIAVGACSAVPQRLAALEKALAGQRASPDIAARLVTPAHLAGLSPIDDVRGSAQYRRDAALVLVRRALAECLAAPLGAAA
ncbi:MAG TPA: FAD binding domain-containing protein [Hyphomicrobiaceae bacterium]|nr:FAD binding domain-containing protein [Hyphomicrobiaceae bacterium]